ncbi:hypothetical protein [Leptobacterium sp. I13]|uniref:hypothetical protein n=1 Tax=Leptobacterium meishanense TaxID=3128904 RepID=UPI0030EFA4E5
MLNSKFDIFFKINKEVYHGVTIRAIHSKAELFYHYPWGSRTKSKYGHIGKKELLDGYLNDHISFHNNGNIHSKSRDGNKKKIYINKINPGLNVFNLNRGGFLPILVESFNLTDILSIEKRFKKVDFDEEAKSGIGFIDVKNLKYFSLLLISKCERVNPLELLKDHGFENLTIISPPIIMVDIFKNEEKKLSLENSSGFSTELLIIAVEEIWEEFSQRYINEKEGLGIPFSNTVCMPPMPLIEKMKNHN